MPGRGVSAPGGCLIPGGVPAPGGCLLLGGCLLPGVPGGDPPGWLLLRAVRILLECILVETAVNFYAVCKKYIQRNKKADLISIVGWQSNTEVFTQFIGTLQF